MQIAPYLTGYRVYISCAEEAPEAAACAVNAVYVDTRYTVARSKI